MREKSSKQFDSVSEMLAQQDQAGQVTAEYEFTSVAEWPDEEKPKVEAQFRRRRPIEGAWVLLGNDELWLIPEVEYLGKDIEIVEKKGVFGKIVSFRDSYKHYRQLRELLAKVLGSQNNDEFRIEWEDAYMLMYLAVQCNYKISADEINRLGLLRQEHIRDILAALSGSVKKKDTSADLDLPLPLTAVNSQG